MLLLAGWFALLVRLLFFLLAGTARDARPGSRFCFLRSRHLSNRAVLALHAEAPAQPGRVRTKIRDPWLPTARGVPVPRTKRYCSDRRGRGRGRGRELATFKNCLPARELPGTGVLKNRISLCNCRVG